MARMWGIRNLSLAAGMYAATGDNRAQWWRLQVAVDALDFLAISEEWRRGAVPGPAAGLMASTALAAATLGALPSRASRRNQVKRASPRPSRAGSSSRRRLHIALVLRAPPPGVTQRIRLQETGFRGQVPIYRGDWIRTSDRSAPSRVRYQTAPRPVAARFTPRRW